MYPWPLDGPKKMSELESIYELLQRLSKEEKRLIYAKLKVEVNPHALEAAWNIDAETLMEAVNRSAPITQRNLKGIVAEASFKTNVLDLLDGWEDVTPPGAHSYDYLIQDASSQVSVQVKLQRRSEVTDSPIETDGVKTFGYKFEAGYYIVEPQKTRTQLPERLYRFDEFDILAVSLYPATNDWARFHYSLARWLLPHKKYGDRMNQYQPVAKKSNELWTDSLETAVEWLRSSEQKKIWMPSETPLF